MAAEEGLRNARLVQFLDQIAERNPSQTVSRADQWRRWGPLSGPLGLLEAPVPSVLRASCPMEKLPLALLDPFIIPVTPVTSSCN